MRSHFRSCGAATILLAGTLGLAACDQTHPLPPEPASVPAHLVVVSGNNQVAAPGASLPEPLVVRVVDANGNPIPSQIINFAVVAGGGEVFGGVTLTNPNGLAYEWWTLGPSDGAQVVEARAVDPGSGEKQVFATFGAMADTATSVAEVEVSPFTVTLTVGSTEILTAVAKNATGESVQERTFTWSSSSPLVATVDANGLVTAVSAGTATISAESGGRAGSSEITVSSTRKPRRPAK